MSAVAEPLNLGTPVTAVVSDVPTPRWMTILGAHRQVVQGFRRTAARLERDDPAGLAMLKVANEIDRLILLFEMDMERAATSRPPEAQTDADYVESQAAH